MNAGEIRLGPGVMSLAALGARSFEDFFQPVGAPGFERARLLEEGPGVELVRYPLPGTPDERGRLRGVPEGAGTGWLWLRRFDDASLAACWRARFTEPRSTSLAEREWNLVCHLRAAGVGAPEPLAVGRGRGSVFARRSFVVLRELEEMQTLARWLQEPHERRAESRVARALGLAFGRLFDAGVVLPALDPENIWIAPPRIAAHEDETCVARTIDALRAATRGEPAQKRLRWGRLPEVAFTTFAGGRIVGALDLERRMRALLQIASLSPPPIDPRSALRVMLGATPAVERDAWRTWARSPSGRYGCGEIEEGLVSRRGRARSTRARSRSPG